MRIKPWVMLFAALCMGRAQAEDAAITVCYDKYPPYALGEFGQESQGGIKVRLLQEIGKQLGLKVTVKILPWKRCQSEAKEGRVDGILPLYKTAEREQYLAFSVPVMKQFNCFMYRKSLFRGEVDWADYASLAKYKLGMEIGSVVDKSMEDAFSASHAIERAADSITLIRMIESGRIDMATVDSNVGRYLLNQQGVTETIGLSNAPIGQMSDAAFGFSKAAGAQRWVPEFNRIIEKMRATGQLDKLLGSKVE
ncbi:ABC transporter substrate-binding protein [Chromobacterium sp. IIBBL 290-4]|uniref:substrate-binding periplasmic protein n=1 Tax=Chromobacterium sp. IIBBL 290-4 TaxID=2953890 RepID=UPI0020B7BEBD|nr:transporter substrate-binding domain-containing protein [Chromobacterium sp. IIBBL 290-4]UTH73645.1 transporter substrate-binding domain-containing protein [Chromobacterium sp. IIBBL 290-4]